MVAAVGVGVVIGGMLAYQRLQSWPLVLAAIGIGSVVIGGFFLIVELDRRRSGW